MKKFRSVTIKEETHKLLKKLLKDWNERNKNYYYPMTIPKFIDYLTRQYEKKVNS